MKKKSLLFLLILLSSCGGNPTEQPSQQPTSQQPTSEQPTSEDPTESIFTILENCRTYSSVRNFVTIKNGSEKIYEVLQRIQYDSVNNYLLEIYQENGKNGLNGANPTYQLSKEIYYDGEYSFSLDSDGIYIREKCEKEIKAPTNSFDYSVLENIEVSQNGFRNILTATVSENNVKTLLNNDVDGVSNFTFEATINGDILEELEFAYTQNNLTVTRNIQYTYHELEIVIPTTYKTLN